MLRSFLYIRFENKINKDRIMRFPTDDPERRTRIRLDFLIALMVVQIVLSIGLWVDRYRDRSEPASQAAEKHDGAFDELYTEQPRSSRSEPGVTELPISEPVKEPVVPAKVKVQILNGCGKQGIAKRAQKWMESNDYDVRDVGNADRQDYRSSEVLNRSGNAAAARDLARMLGIDESKIKRKAAAPGLDVDLTLIIGADNKRLPFGR